MKKLSLYFVLGVFIFIYFGCSSTQQFRPRDESTQENQKGSGIINEYFDPLILDDEELEIKKTISTESISDKMETVLTDSAMEEERTEELPGFRVQICAVSEEEKARQIQREAILRFIDQEVYLIYNNPYYKVRVGNCLTRYDADKLQQLAVEKGFTDAWVVRTKVKPDVNEDDPQNPEIKSPN